MKKIISLFLGAIAVMLSACSGSATYQGNWKGMTPEGQKADIVFESKKLIICDTSGQSSIYDYTQNSVNITNSVEAYGITLGDGRGYEIKFPIANDESIGVIRDENGNVLYAIGRKDYVKPGDMYKLR